MVDEGDGFWADRGVFGGHTWEVAVCVVEGGFSAQSFDQVGGVGVVGAVGSGGDEGVAENAFGYELVMGAIAPEVMMSADGEATYGIIEDMHYLLEAACGDG